MNLRNRIFAGLLAVLGGTAAGTAQVVLIDFGNQGPSLSTPGNNHNGATWNTLGSVNGTVSDLLDSSGNPTSVSAATFGWSNQGSNGSDWPAGDTGWVDAGAVDDYFFSSAPSGSERRVTIGGLNAGMSYSISAIGARSGATAALADFTINGSFADSTPNGDDLSMGDAWTSGTILTWNSVQPSLGGEIVLLINKPASGVGSTYLNAMRVAAVPEPEWTVLATAGVLAGFTLLRRRNRR